MAGNLIRFTAEFRDESNVLVDPTDVTAIVYGDEYDAWSLTVTQVSEGVYQADWDTAGVPGGIYYCEFIGTGAVIAAEEIRLRIRAPHT